MLMAQDVATRSHAADGAAANDTNPKGLWTPHLWGVGKWVPTALASRFQKSRRCSSRSPAYTFFASVWVLPAYCFLISLRLAGEFLALLNRV